MVVAHPCYFLFSYWLVAAEGINVVIRARLVLLGGLQTHPLLVIWADAVHRDYHDVQVLVTRYSDGSLYQLRHSVVSGDDLKPGVILLHVKSSIGQVQLGLVLKFIGHARSCCHLGYHRVFESLTDDFVSSFLIFECGIQD